MHSLAKLFGSAARLKLLRLFLFNQELSLTSAEASERAKLSREAVRKELADLVASGFLRKRGNGVAARFQVNPRYEHLEALNVFVRETTSVKPQEVMKELKKVGNLRAVVLSGFFSGAIEPQVDLLVVGDSLNDRQLSRAVRALEAELGREIRYASFATADFRYRQGVYDRLLRDVFDYPHRLVLDKIGL